MSTTTVGTSPKILETRPAIRRLRLGHVILGVLLLVLGIMP